MKLPPRGAKGRFLKTSDRDYDFERKIKAARLQLGIVRYEALNNDCSEELMRAMPATVMEVKDNCGCGLSYTAVWERVQELYDMGWIHIGAWKTTNRGDVAVYHAGPGEDIVPRGTAAQYKAPVMIPRDPNRKATPFDALLGVL